MMDNFYLRLQNFIFIENPWFEISLYLAGFIVFAIGLGSFAKNRLQYNEALLIRTKQEMQAIAQLALTNPYPLIQLSAKGEVLFANPAALASFKNIHHLGARHPCLSDIYPDSMVQGYYERDILFEGRVFH